MRAVPTPSTLIGAIGAGEQARRIKNQEQISAVLQEEGILMVAFYEMLNGIAWASLFMSVKWTTRFKTKNKHVVIICLGEVRCLTRSTYEAPSG